MDNSNASQVNSAFKSFLKTISDLHGNERRRAVDKWKRQNKPEWRERVDARSRAYYRSAAGREKYRQWEAAYKQKPEVRIKRALRRRLQNAVECQKTVRRFKSRESIGCSPEFLRQYLESQFKRGMSWANYGTYWEIDHIIPISKFDLTQPEEQRRANHFTNLRPLRKEDNQSKKDKLQNAQMGLLLTA